MDSVPADLVDNAAILGTLSLITAALFLLDMGGPKAKKISSHSQTPLRSTVIKPSSADPRTVEQQVVYDIEKEIEYHSGGKERNKHNLESFEKPPPKYHTDINSSKNVNGGKNGFVVMTGNGGVGRGEPKQNNYATKPIKSFDIYGKDVYGPASDTDEVDDVPPKMEEHSPIWSKIRNGRNL